MPESFADQLSRVRLMAQQRPSAYVEMLPEDLAALTAVLEQLDRVETDMAVFEEMNAGMKEGFTVRLGDIQNEIKSVLTLMDGLVEQWGDESVLRRCRDWLRALVQG